MIIELGQALSSIKFAYDIVKGIKDLKDATQFNSKVIELQNTILSAQEKIISAQEKQSLLEDKMQELEKECERLKDWSSEKERYSRKQIAPGVFAYVDNSYPGPTANTHKLCCNCFDKSIKSTLQQSREIGRRIGLICPNGCPKLVFNSYS